MTLKTVLTTYCSYINLDGAKYLWQIFVEGNARVEDRRIWAQRQSLFGFPPSFYTAFPCQYSGQYKAHNSKTFLQSRNDLRGCWD